MATNERKDTQARVDAMKAEQQIQANLSAILQKNLDGRTREGRILKENTQSILEAKSLEDKLLEIANAKDTVINEIWDTNQELAKSMLEQLETAEKLAKTEKQRKDLTEEIKDVGKDFAKDMGSALGISNGLVDAFMTLSVAAIGLAILKEVAGYIADGVARAKELKHELGISAEAAGKLESSVAMAKVQTGFLTYSTEELRAAADAVVAATGRINVSPEAIANVTEMGKLLSDGNDAAVSLNRTLTNSGLDAGVLTEEVKSMAESMGMEAGPAMDYLAASQNELVGMTKEQVLLKAKEGIEMKKLGVDMKKARDIASSSLDIESSLRNEMKLRTMLGKEISFNELRAAQASGDALAVAQAQKNLVDQLGPSLKGNLQVQRMVSDATGMTADELLNIQNATAENTKLAQDGNKTVTEGNAALGFMAQHWKAILGGILVVVGALLLMGKIKLPGMGGDKNPAADFIGKFGTTEVLKGAAAMLLVAASMFVMAKAISAMPTEPGPYLGMAVGLGLMLGALRLLAEFPTADLLKGALALAVVGVSLIPFAFAMNLIGDISIGAILAVAAGILIFTGIIMGLGLVMFSGIGAMIFGAGVLALLALGAALIVLGAGVVLFNKGVGGLGDNISLFVEKMAELISIAPMMLGAVVPLVLFGIALIPFALGLAMAAVPMMVFGLAMIPFVAGMTALSGVMPIFVDSVAKLGEQVPNLIAIAGGFGLFAASLMLASAAMLPFLPIFTITTLSMLALVPAMIIGSAGIGIWSLSLSTLSDSIARLMPNLTAFLGTMPMMAAMVMLVPGLIALSASFFILSGSLMALTLGLASIALMLPVLAALGVLLPTVSAVFNGDGGDSAKESSEGGGVSMKEVVDEIRGLRKDIQSQPIMITVDGRVVSEITKVQNRKNSTRNTGYGG